MTALLPLTVFLPLLAAIALLAIPRDEEGLHRGIGLGASLLTFFLSLGLLAGFEPAQWNSVVDWLWVKDLGIHYKLGLDGISLWLYLLTTFLMPVVFASAWTAVHKKVREFIIALLVLESGMLGCFAAIDMFTFYVYWEVMLIPMYFIIGIWGGDRRLYASIKFVLFTMVGSLLMIVAILYMAVKFHDVTGTWSFDYDDFRKLVLGRNEQLACFGAFALAFCIKVPLFPLHTWLPDAHVEAPTAGSVILAGVLLKFGTYGLLRFAFPFFPAALAQTAPLLTVLAVTGVVYGSLVAWAQTDVKKLVAYSSVAHLGMVVLGLLAWNGRGINGAMLTMLGHGISTGGLFLAIGVLYERRHTRRMDEFGGIWSQMPRFATVFMIMTLASIGLPGLSGFPGEFMILLGSFDGWRTWADQGMPIMFAILHPKLVAAIAATGVIFGAVYMLWMFQKVMFGPNANPKNHKLLDLSPREIAVFVPMVLGAFWLGIHPSTFLKDIDPAVQHVLGDFKAKYAESPDKLDTPRVMGFERPKVVPGTPPPSIQPNALPGQPSQLPSAPTPSGEMAPHTLRIDLDTDVEGSRGQHLHPRWARSAGLAVDGAAS